MRRPRKQTGTSTRCWTTHIFNREYKNHPPVSFKKSVEIIEEMHAQMVEFVLTKRRPVQLKRSIGYLELGKLKRDPRRSYIINWKKTNEKGKWVKEMNHHTSGYVFSIRLQLTDYNGLRYFKFSALDRHKMELRNRIFSGDVQ